VTFTTADSTGAQIVGDVGGVPLSSVGKVDRYLKMGSFDMQGHRRYSRIGWQTTDRRVPHPPTRIVTDLSADLARRVAELEAENRRLVKVHWSSGTAGLGPADSTGKSFTICCAGGTVVASM